MARDRWWLRLELTEHFSREMGFTLEELMHPLPAAVAPHPFRLEGRCIYIEHPAGEVRITLQQSTERRIASMVIPCTVVEFGFYGLDAEQRRQFMQRFDLYTQRGGG